MSRPDRSRTVAAAAALIALAGLGLAAGADLLAPAPAATPLTTPTETASPRSVALGCAPGILDPLDPYAAGLPAQWWTSTGPAQGETAGSALTATADAGATVDVPTGVVVAGQGGGELRGLGLIPCQAASGDQWLAAGSTEVGEDLVLVLVNPGQTASQVSVSAIGAAGPAGDPQSVTVPAGQAVTALPAAWFPDQTRPALHVQADGPGVVAWLQSSGMDGEVPTGLTWASSLRAAPHLVLPGVEAGAPSSMGTDATGTAGTDATEAGTAPSGGSSAATLRLGVPGEDPATVSVTVATADGVRELAGATGIQIDPGTTLDLDLAGLPGSGPVTLIVDADQPVLATALTAASGAAWPGGGQTWMSRTAVAPALALTRTALPGAQALADLIDQQMTADAARATTVPTSSGADGIAVSLVLANTGDQPARVTLGGQSVDVPVGTTVIRDLPAGPSSLEVAGAAGQSGDGGDGGQSGADVAGTDAAGQSGDGGDQAGGAAAAPSSATVGPSVHAAVLATVTTPTGPVTAVWPLGAEGLSARSMPVAVIP